jgi:Ca-activated chloride channel family protein
VLSLATLFPDAGIDLSQITGQRNMAPGPNDKPKPEFTPVAPGSYASAAIILLTDGQRTTGPDPVEAAKMAADRGVRVYTVGIGTKEGETIGFEGWSMRVRLDEDTLKSIANITRADYFYAGTAENLKTVYQGLSTRLVVEKKETEISALFALLGALLTVTAAALSVWWFGRVA